MTLNKDEKCEEPFESVKINYDKGMPNCSPFGGSGYYFTIMLMQSPMSYGNGSSSNHSYGMNESYSNHSYNDYGKNMSYKDYGDNMSHEG